MKSAASSTCWKAFCKRTEKDIGFTGYLAIGYGLLLCLEAMLLLRRRRKAAVWVAVVMAAGLAVLAALWFTSPM